MTLRRVDTGTSPRRIGVMEVRRASVGDAAACAAIYAPYVRDTAVSFESEPPTAGQLADRIRVAQQHHDWLVLVGDGIDDGIDDGDRVLGYCYAGTWRTRPAYRFTCELGIYLAPEAQGLGGGRLLYEALLERLAGLGYRTAVAGMTQSPGQPNPASEALHLALGFEPAGVMRRVGWKLGSWHDVAFFQRSLAGADPDPEDLPPPHA